MQNYISYDASTKEITISGLGIGRLTNRINEVYTSSSGYKSVKGSNITKIFNSMEYITWLETEIKFYSFFSLEVYNLFSTLAEEYHDDKYADVADELYQKTWISNFERKQKVRTDLSALSKFNIAPKDFQLEFIKNYNQLKVSYDLDGYILSFEQGLGKTFTAVAIGECNKKEIYYIVCPNSVKLNWAKEIQSYFKVYNNNENLWKKEVYVSGMPGYIYDKNTTKFIIINQESIPNIFPFIDKTKNSMIVIDECQNFRGIGSKRVAAMLKLKELSGSHDCLLMSGTPIKAMATELIPALRMIDPYFTEELADIYYKTFSDSSIAISDIVKARFSRVIYRKLKKDVVSLPERYDSQLRMNIPHSELYSTTKVRAEILKQFHTEYLKRLESGLFTNNKLSKFYRASATDYDYLGEKILFENTIRKYSSAHSTITEKYLDFIFQRDEDQNTQFITAMNVEDKYFGFIQKYVLPRIKDPKDIDIVTKRFNGIFGWAIAAKGAASTVIGKTLAMYKNNCFINIWKYNYQEFLDMIQKAKKKTIIFTALVPIADYISDDLTKHNIKNIKITGNEAGRDKLISTFKNDSKTQVMVATTETMSMGLTLTEANQILFFGTPYRYTDYDQACDRIHRIGQDTPCYIYNILLSTRDKNITDRIDEIMNWSDEMFSSLIKECIL